MPQTSLPHILIVEDSEPLARTYEEYLKAAGYKVTTAGTGKEALAAMQKGSFAGAVLDVQLPDMTGIEILSWIRGERSEMPAVIITAHGTINIAVEAMREGAYDFIVKPFTAARLQVTVKNALSQYALVHEVKNLVREVKQLRSALDQESYFDFIGRSQVMQAVYRTIDAVAASKASVFITGESGTGKELAAQAIHKASPRRDRPFIALNCAAIPKDLLESHIFGHVKGAFTGAVSDRIGAGQAADGGTLFLDEIGEMPLELQAKMLRFIQTGELQQVGSTKTEKVNVRFVAATNRDPLVEVKSGKFREDLYYRLHVVPLELPPLRDREEDILILARYFLNKFATEDKKDFSGITEDVARLFMQHPWPGNVRQMENLIRNIVVLNDGKDITRDMLPEAFRDDTKDVDSSSSIPAFPPSSSSMRPAAVLPLWQVEKNAILAALDSTEQDVSKAAAMLEVSPSTLYRKLQAWKEG